MSGAAVRIGAAALALAATAALAMQPLLTQGRLSGAQAALALAGVVSMLQAVTFVPPLALAGIPLLAAEMVVGGQDAATTRAWTIPLTAFLLIVGYEATEIRHRVAVDTTVEVPALRALVRGLLVSGSVGALAAAAALGGAAIPSRGGAGAGVVGVAAVCGLMLLIKVLASPARIVSRDEARRAPTIRSRWD